MDPENPMQPDSNKIYFLYWSQSRVLQLNKEVGLVTYSDLHCPDAVVSKHLMFSQGHLERTEITSTRVWPVLLTLALVTFYQVGYHDNDGGFLLPY